MTDSPAKDAMANEVLFVLELNDNPAAPQPDVCPDFATRIA